MTLPFGARTGYFVRLLRNSDSPPVEKVMTWRDKMEIGLKGDAPFRRDNLPTFEIEGPQVPAGRGRSPIVPAAAGEAAKAAASGKPRRRRSRAAVPRTTAKAATKTARRRP
jgi:hypothetical protein